MNFNCISDRNTTYSFPAPQGARLSTPLSLRSRSDVNDCIQSAAIFMAPYAWQFGVDVVLPSVISLGSQCVAYLKSFSQTDSVFFKPCLRDEATLRLRDLAQRVYDLNLSDEEWRITLMGSVQIIRSGCRC